MGTRTTRTAVLGALLAAASVPAAAQVAGGVDVVRGRVVVLESGQACFACHGLNGAADPSGGFPRLDGQSAWYLYKQLHDFAAGLRPSAVMGPIAAMLGSREMEDVAVYYAAQPAAALPGPDVDAGEIRLGEAIVAAGIADRGIPPCQSCHGAGGRGVPPVYPRLAGQYAPYTRLQLSLWREGSRGNDPLGVMSTIAAALTDEEIRAIAVYLESAGAAVANDVP